MRDEKIFERNGFKYIRMPSGKLYSFQDAIHNADLAESAFSRAISRAFALLPDWPDEPESERAAYRDMDYERIEWALDNMESYLAAVREHLDKQRRIKLEEDRIAKLRQMAGRTPKEIEAFRKKADELEHRLRVDNILT